MISKLHIGERKTGMKKQMIILIVNACIWAFTVIMTAYTLRGTGAYQQIQLILSGGALASLMVVGTGIIPLKKR